MQALRQAKRTLASRIEHTLLSPSATSRDLRDLINETEEYGFRCAVVPPHMVRDAAGISSKPVCTVAGFPLGYQPLEAKLAEVESAISAGAAEVDVVMNVSAFLDGRRNMVAEEVRAIVGRAHARGVAVKIIVETGLIGDAVEEAADLVARAGADFIKTCTGFGPRGVTIEDVARIRRAARGRARIKAAGGVREAAFALLLLAAGADTIGTSRGPGLVDGLESLGEELVAALADRLQSDR